MSVETVNDSWGRNHRPIANRRAKLAVVLSCVGLSIIAVVPFFFMGRYADGTRDWRVRMPYTHDMFLHYDQMRSFYSGLKAGELYPRWEEDTNHGFGAPTTIFYPPGIYYLTSLCHLFAVNWNSTLLLAHLLMMVSSAAALYFYARRSLSRASSALAMALYIMLPYHLTDQYQREALAELLGFIWMPLILLSLDCLFRRPRKNQNAAANVETDHSTAADSPPGHNDSRSILPDSNRALATAGLAVSYGAFVWSHPPTAYQFGLILAILIPLLAVLRRDFSGMILSGVGIALGLGLSAAYLYPAAVEKALIKSQFIAENWPYHESYVFMRTQYMLDHWPFFSLIENVWCLNVAIIALCFVAIVIWARKMSGFKRGIGEQAVVWLVAGLLASFLMTRASFPLSKHIPMIDIGVFSWRMLSITTLAAALFAGAAADCALTAARSRRYRLAGSLATILALAVVASVGLSIWKVIVPAYAEDVFVPETEHINYAMMPAAVDSEPEDLPDDDLAGLDNGNGIAVVRSWQPEHRLVHVELDDSDALFLRTFDYPGWTAHVDGKPVDIHPSDDLDEIEVDLPAGVHEVAFDFTDTIDRRRGRYANAFAAIMVLFVGSLGFAQRWNLRHRT